MQENTSNHTGISLGVVDREIRVTATSEITALPDRCLLMITVTSVKSLPHEAKNSVARRVDYAIQTLHNHDIKEKCVQVTKTLTRDQNMFNATSEIRVEFCDFTKCQLVSNHIVEKLDESVEVSQPLVYHSASNLENARRQASLLAVHNAKQKAREIANLVKQSVGRLVMMSESEMREEEGVSSLNPATQYASPLQREIRDKTVTLTARLCAVFELKYHKTSHNQI